MHENAKNTLLRAIPKVEKILNNPLFSGANKEILKNIATREIARIRAELAAPENNAPHAPESTPKNPQSPQDSRDSRRDLPQDSAPDSPQKFKSSPKDSPHAALAQTLTARIHAAYLNATQLSLKPLINATGVVLQTNLGRSIFSREVLEEVLPLLSRYSNVEYDLEQGGRGGRDSHLREPLCALFGCEDALVVNNNAAAVFLILNTFAKNKETIVSRGELVEIGGSFRMPEIMAAAQTRLVEVGTSNKTRLSDYEGAINTESAVLMKAHKSNFAQIGFVAEVAMSEISALCRERGLIDYYDLGSGYFCGVPCEEPSIGALFKNAKTAPSLLSFSGDKLFGAAQAGVILGRRDLVEKLRKNPLLRTFRVDKVTILLIAATLKRYALNRPEAIPTIRMLSLNAESLHQRAHALAANIDSFFNPQVIALESLAGGGSLPDKTFESFGVSLEVENFRAIELEKRLRSEGVIARILKNKVALDVRTLQDGEGEKTGVRASESWGAENSEAEQIAAILQKIKADLAADSAQKLDSRGKEDSRHLDSPRALDSPKDSPHSRRESAPALGADSPPRKAPQKPKNPAKSTRKG